MADPFDDFDGLTPPKKTGAQKFGPMAILSALLPIAMAKGGREGVAGLMQGFQSAMQRQQQGQQEQQEFGLRQQQAQDTTDYRRRQEERQGRTDQFDRDKAASDFWSKFMAEVPTWESPDVARQRVGAWAEGGSLLGIPAGRFESHALQMATPDRLKVRAIRNKWASLSADEKKIAHHGQGMSMRLNPDEQPVPYALWAPIVGGLEDPTTGKAPIAAQTRQRPVSLGEGAVLVDPDTGQVIAEGKPKREPRGPEPDFEWVVRNGQPVQIRKGTARQGDRPYAAGKEDTGPSPYAAERNVRNLQSVDELIGKVNNWTTGAGSLLRRIPATDARNFAAELDTLKANIAFGELTAMREASKTGGALGQVSNIELGLLSSALGALDAGQSPGNLKAQLKKVRDSIERWEAAKAGGGGGGTLRADPLGIR